MVNIINKKVKYSFIKRGKLNEIRVEKKENKKILQKNFPFEVFGLLWGHQI